jgi:hypothetical protein
VERCLSEDEPFNRPLEPVYADADRVGEAAVERP